MKKGKIKNKLYWVFAIIFCVIIVVIMLFELKFINFSGTKFNDSGDSSGEKVSTTSGKYKIDVYDDEIDFIDDNGNTIIYAFSDDRLSAVMEILILNNNEDAEVVKEFYELKIPSGEIERVVRDENMISVKYNIEYFEEYMNYTKDELQSILLESSNFKQEN